MNIFRFETEGGKDLILEFINKLPKKEKALAHIIQKKLGEDGLKALDTLTTRQLRKKLWEIKFSNNRLMYVIEDSENMYILHACKKEKNKAEKFEIEKAIQRANELGKELGKSFV